MENKLQELTQKLYSEGLEKGRKEADALVEDAKKQVAKLLDEAKAQANKIVCDAQKEAAEIKSRTEQECLMAARQFASNTRQQIEQIITAKALASNVEASMKDTDFIKEVILHLAKSFNPTNAESLNLNIVLPEEMKAQFTSLIENGIDKALKEKLHFSFNDNIKSGFEIIPEGESYKLNFTAEDFTELFGNYLRPSTKKILFNK